MASNSQWKCLIPCPWAVVSAVESLPFAIKVHHSPGRGRRFAASSDPISIDCCASSRLLITVTVLSFPGSRNLDYLLPTVAAIAFKLEFDETICIPGLTIPWPRSSAVAAPHPAKDHAVPSYPSSAWMSAVGRAAATRRALYLGYGSRRREATWA